jgi:hypothetical protein
METVVVSGSFLSQPIVINFVENGARFRIICRLTTPSGTQSVTRTDVQIGNGAQPDIQSFSRGAATPGGSTIRFEYGPVIPPDPITIIGSLQPLSGDEIVRIPEGDRTRERRKIYSLGLLKTEDESNEGKADLVIIDGLKWQVERVEAWPSFWKAFLVRLEEDAQ